MKLRNIPIQRKLTIIIMLTTSIVLALTFVSLIVYEVNSFRRTLVQEMRTIARVIAANSTAAVAFNDQDAATEILSALRAEDNVRSAVLYGEGGSALAYYAASPGITNFPALPDFIGHRFEGGELLMVEPVERAGTRTGLLVLRADLHDVYARLSSYGVILALVFLGSSAMAFLVSRWLQGSISDPILELAQTARVVSAKNDYSVRARKFGEDEMGELTDAFNNMLRQIDARDLELLSSRERLKLALSASQTGTWQWNLQTDRMVMDEYTERLFGLEPGTFKGGSEQMIALFHPRDRASVKAAVEATLAHGEELNTEGRVVWQDGSEHHLALRGTAISDPGAAQRSVRVTGVCMDITERHRAEERIKKLNAELEERVMIRTAELTASHQEMEAFTYSVSHDLRAPLRHITAFAEILLEEFGDGLSAEARDYLQRILRGTQSMSQLVDDLLNLARVGRQGLSLQKVNLNEIIKEIIADFQPELKQRVVHWKIHPIPEISADPGLIRQVMANLISNAIKYTRPTGEAQIEIGAETYQREIVVYVRDNGVGFDMQFADKLFGVFQRLHRSEDFEGTGVGLALVERIVRKHGGRVWAESDPGKGAAFFFAIPVSVADSKVSSTGSGSRHLAHKV